MAVLDYEYGGEEGWWDEDADAGAYYEEDAWYDPYEPARPGPAVNPLILIGLPILIFLAFFLILPKGSHGAQVTSVPPAAVVPAPLMPAESQPAAPQAPLTASSFVAPYDEYWVTQGPHGQSYGHYAIDIAAGKGSPIYSPIAGRVAEKYTDGYGNPVLVLENDYYKVTMLHGIYTVNVGDEVQHGQTVGEESNIGYTTDMQGRLCTNRDCGYHTHLNVYDKQQGRNVNPLDLLPPAETPLEPVPRQ